MFFIVDRVDSNNELGMILTIENIVENAIIVAYCKSHLTHKNKGIIFFFF